MDLTREIAIPYLHSLLEELAAAPLDHHRLARHLLCVVEHVRALVARVGRRRVDELVLLGGGDLRMVVGWGANLDGL